jgi:hypothetical protein
MPYTSEFFIGYGTFIFWIGVAFFTARRLSELSNPIEDGIAEFVGSLSIKIKEGKQS